MPFLTIITPTYNRAYIIGKAYESLCLQECADFEWIVIDDGSNDDTEKIMNKIQNEKNKFLIKYFKKENGGKHTALNYVHNYIAGEIVLILDSDDILHRKAVKIVMLYWQKYKSDLDIGILSFQKADLDTKKTIGKEFPQEEYRSNHIKYRINLGINSDKCEVIRSDIFKKYPFPVFIGETFLGESYLWIKTAYSFDTIYIKKNIYFCKYTETGLTKSGRKMRLKNPYGGMLHGSLYLNKSFKMKYRVKGMMLYICYGCCAKKSLKNLFENTEYKKLFLFVIPFGVTLYYWWKWRWLK